MILALASAAHGRNVTGQWYIVAIAASLYGIVGLAAHDIYMAALCFLFVPLYWLMFRRGAQADIEMRCMDTGHAFRTRLRDVLRAHYYVGWLTCLGLWLFNYSTERGIKLGWEKKAVDDGGKWRGKPVRLIANDTRVHPDDFPFWDCRRPTEFLTGLTGDLMIGVILTIAGGSA